MDKMIIRPIQDETGLKYYYEFGGLSTDDKPVASNMVSGSLFHEVDTATIYAYDRSTGSWYKQIELGGDS